MKYKIAILIDFMRNFYSTGDLEKHISINVQIRDSNHDLVAIKSFMNVTPAQAARAVVLQNKLARRK